MRAKRDAAATAPAAAVALDEEEGALSVDDMDDVLSIESFEFDDELPLSF